MQIWKPHIIRRALSLLTTEGYIQPIHGRGVRVIYMPHKKHDFTSSGIEGLNQLATRNGFHVTNQVITFTEMIADERLSQKTDFEVGMPIRTVKRCVTVERTILFDEKYLDLDDYNCLAVITSHVFNNDGIQFEYTESRNRPDIFIFYSANVTNINIPVFIISSGNSYSKV